MRLECNEIANEENKVECVISEGDSSLYLTVSNKEFVAEIGGAFLGRVMDYGDSTLMVAV